MTFRRRWVYGLAIAGVVAALVVGVLLSLGVGSSGKSAPDLTALAKQLTSADPRVQEQALVPGGQADPGQPPGVLPAGSTLQVKPKTWQVTGVDSAGAPAAGRIRARLTRPGQASAEVDLDVFRIGGQWLLYETSPL